MGQSTTSQQKYAQKLAALYNGFFQTDHNYCWWVDFILELNFFFSFLNNLFIYYTVHTAALSLKSICVGVFFMHGCVRQLIYSNLMSCICCSLEKSTSVSKRNVINPTDCLKCFAIFSNSTLSRGSMGKAVISVRGSSQYAWSQCRSLLCCGRRARFKLLLFSWWEKIMAILKLGSFPWSKSFSKSLTFTENLTWHNAIEHNSVAG